MGRKIEPVKPLSKDEYRKLIETLVPEGTKAFYIEYWHDDDDHQFGFRKGGKRETKIGRKRIVRDAVKYYEAYGYSRHTEAPLITEGEKAGQKDYTKCEPRPPKDLAEVFSDVACQNGGEDNEFGGCYVISAKQMAKQQEEELRQKGEAIAGMICSKYKVKAGTLKFIHACHKHYNQIIESERFYRDDPERRMERWAEYQYAGAGRETFFSDNDYASGQIAEADENLQVVLSYLERFAPLLMTRYREVLARKKEAAKESGETQPGT